MTRDALRVVALLGVLQRIADRKFVSLGTAATEVFGWSTERVFLAIECAVKEGRIAPGGSHGGA